MTLFFPSYIGTKICKYNNKGIRLENFEILIQAFSVTFSGFEAEAALLLEHPIIKNMNLKLFKLNFTVY